jgi:hypothetical protein
MDVKKFLELIEKANFWSMSTTDNNQRKVYDGVPWIFEGLRDGKYHAVIRDNWPSSLSSELMRYLTIDLGKVDASGIPR